MFHLIITKADEHLFEGSVVSVTAPGYGGEFTVLANHEPFITLLKKGVLLVRESLESDAPAIKIEIEKGMIEVSANKATILV